jgi:hypothetical protein
MYPPMIRAQAAHTCQSRVVNWNVKAVQKTRKYRYKIDPKFSQRQENFIREALKIAVERMQDKSVWQEVKNTYGFAYPTPKSIRNAGFCNSLNIRRNILFHQLYYISVPEGNRLNTTKLPDVQIYYKDEAPPEGKIGWLGKAPYDVVNIYWSNARNRWQKSGHFKISINAHYLFKNEMYSSSEYWAGILVHEMLHNLGHRHPRSTHPDYRKYQINVMASAIQNYGQDSAGPATSGYPVYACSGN